MRYEGAVYRPPSEGRSLIVQATIGCSHNKCSFCEMYKAKKFRMRKVEEVIEDLRDARTRYKHIDKIFLADGDALIMPTDRLVAILKAVRTLFPECNRVTIYGSAKSILLKSEEELSLLKQNGLYMIYLGVESGDDEILAKINKGVSAAEMIMAGKKVKSVGMKISCTIISGLGGKEKWREHAKNSAKLMNEIDPDYLGLLTLMISDKVPMAKEIKEGRLTLLSPKEVMVETYELAKGLNLTNCVFRSNHASNYVSLAAILDKEREVLLDEIKSFIDGKDMYIEEDYRSL